MKAAALGGIYGMCGGWAMPRALKDLFITQAQMVLAIRYLYGWSMDEEDMASEILLVMGGANVTGALKKAGISIGQEFAKKSVDKFVTREIMKKINRVVSRRIITKAGQKSLTSFAKLVPVAGAPPAAVIDYLGTRAIGKTALSFYRR